MKKIVQKAELVVEEWVRYEMGPYASEQDAIEVMFAQGASVTWEGGLAVTGVTELGSWSLCAEAEAWSWISTVWVQHRLATADDLRELGLS